MRHFVSIRKKFQLAIISLVGFTLLTLSGITYLVLAKLAQQFAELSDQQNHAEELRLQKDSEDAQQHVISVYHERLRKKGSSLLSKDSMAVRTPFLENSVTYVRSFLIEALQQDPDLYSAAFLVTDSNGTKAWQYVDQQHPQGLGFSIAYDAKRALWLSNLEGKNIELKDPFVKDTLEVAQAEVKAITLDLNGRSVDAYQATIPIYEGQLSQLRKQGEPVAFLRYILSLEGLQKEIAHEQSRLSERLAKQKLEAEETKQLTAEKSRVTLLISLVALLTGGLLLAGLGVVGAALISKKLTGSLSILIQGTKQVAEGDLNSPVEVRSNDEIGLLGEAFDRMRQDLAEKERSRTLFFHNTSHELRTPLNGIMGYIELSCQGRFGEVPPLAKEQLRKALNLAESLKYQVNTILDLAKSKKGELVLHNVQIDLESLKQDTDNLAEGLLLKSELSSYASTLSNSEPGKPFIGDREKIFTVIRNLLGNAFKFRDPIRPNVIELSIQKLSDSLVISIRDSGIGIPESFRDKIFEEFSQVQGDARRHYEGTGLGLAMVKGIVDTMRGSISIQSQPGQGSTFTVTCPDQGEVSLFNAPEESIRLLAPTELSTSAPINHSSPKAIEKVGEGYFVLVIDDNPHNCDVIRETLAFAGYHCESYLSGQTALKLMEQKKPDLILLDMMMPGMSGEDVIHFMKARENLRDIPVILITARASDEDRILGLRMGADDYLAKPIIQDEMLLRVKNILERKELTAHIQKQEANVRLIQLGELFGDLSHEIKNILQNSSDNLQAKDVSFQLLATVVPEELRDSIAEGLVIETSPLYLERIQRLPVPSQLPTRVTLRKLRALVAEINVPDATIEKLWDSLVKEDETNLMFLENNLRIFSNFKLALNLNRRTREMSLAVLDFTREDEAVQIAHFESCLRQTQLIIHTKINRSATRIELAKLARDIHLNLAPGALMQVLINLISNAVDAMSSLPQDQRLVTIVVDDKAPYVVIRVTNAGAPIPDAIADRIFERGFSTKGEKGSGIGLAVSLRLVREAGGDLTLDRSAPTPSFLITLEDAHAHEESLRLA